MLLAISPPTLAVLMAETNLTLREWLIDLRENKKLRQDDVDQKSRDLGVRISQSYLSQLERGIKPISSLGGERTQTLLRIYDVSPEEWARRTGLALTTSTSTVAQATQTLSAIAGVHRVPVIGMASAGAPVSDEEDERIIGWEYPSEDEYRAHMLVLQVDGESMNNGDAKGMQHGDRLYIDPRDLELVEGRIYVIHVHGNGIVVKRARKLGSDWWLFSDNSDFAPTQPDQATIIGRVFYHQPRGMRL